MSEKTDQLAAALVKFQGSVPEIKKTRTANIPTKSGGSYSYKYADLGDIWATIRKPLADTKLAATQTLTGGRDGWTQLTTTIRHESGQSDTTTLDIPTEGKTPQEAGSLFTYYKRYALSAALGISTEEDDDAQAANKPPVKQASSTREASEKQLNLIRGLLTQGGTTKEERDEYVANISTSKQASEAIEYLQKRLDEKKTQGKAVTANGEG